MIQNALIESVQGAAPIKALRRFAIACARLVKDEIDQHELYSIVDMVERGIDSNETIESINSYMYSDIFSNPVSQPAEWIIASNRHQDLFFVILGCTYSESKLRRLSDTAFFRSINQINPNNLQLAFDDIFAPLVAGGANITAIDYSVDAYLLAREIDKYQLYDRMPILADALQDAGCDCIDLLNHCRLCNLHVRGCWALECVLQCHPPSDGQRV